MVKVSRADCSGLGVGAERNSASSYTGYTFDFVSTDRWVVAVAQDRTGHMMMNKTMTGSSVMVASYCRCPFRLPQKRHAEPSLCCGYSEGLLLGSWRAHVERIQII